MLDDGPLSRASRDSPVEVPLSECSTDEAIHFLCVLYSVNGSKITGAAHLSTVRLAHKYGMQAVVASCDDAISDVAGFQCERSKPTYLKGLQKETFLEILDGAVQFNMPKLLVCCEHRIAVDLSDESGLWLPSLLEEHLPVSSAVRIAAALRQMVKKICVSLTGAAAYCAPPRKLATLRTSNPS